MTADPETGLPTPSGGAVTAWLWCMIAMVFAMVVLGGVTRLTQSGLSMVDWRPIMGILPPLSAAAWEDAFAAYRRFPEYRELNYGMTLAEFKAIYLMEYAHRVWGRLIGLAFLLPWLWFVARGKVRGRTALALGGIFLLGAAQGVVGWVMVQSGLVDMPSVSPYRLTVHLVLAVAILGLLFWMVLGRTLVPQPVTDARRLARPALIALGLAALTVISGGFVAGIDAGMTYNTFPLMDGKLVPDGLFMLEPAWRNPFENPAMAQFDHRVLGIATMLAALAPWVRGRGLNLAPRQRLAVNLMALMALVQPGLGITTLLLVVPVPLAAAHQAGALVLLGLILWVLFEARAARARPRLDPAGATG